LITAPDFEARVLARVNDVVITGADLQRAFDALSPEHQMMVRRNLRKFLGALVRREVLYQAALREGLDREPEIADRLADVRRALLTQELLRRARARAGKDDGEEAARRYYDARGDEFASPERVDISHILVTTQDEADAAAARLHAGTPFGTVAQEVSRDTRSRDRGGRLPVVYRGQLSPALEQSAFSLKPGELSAVVRDAEGYHLVLLHGRVPAGVTPFETVRTVIAKKLAATRVEQHRQDLISALEREAHVHVDERALDGIR
jgi:parvulin-like peptidyl-prolyl isomerase